MLLVLVSVWVCVFDLRRASADFPYAGWGVNIHFTDAQPGVTEQVSQAFRLARMDFMWQAIEKVQGIYDFSAYDRLLNASKTATFPVSAFSHSLPLSACSAACVAAASPVTRSR